MLYPRLTNCPECASIPELLKRIDCRLAELGNSLYNNISYMLNQSIPAGDILQLIAYKRILMYKSVNPDYVYHYSISRIASKVILLTLGCESKLTYIPTVRVTTTTTTTPCPTTTTTTSSSSTTTTTTTAILCQDCIAHDVTIGTQMWAGCNLNVTAYTNGDPIPEVTDPTAWAALTTGAWCYYNNDSANGPTYGKLYNWYAVNDPRGLALTGYHVPTDTELTTLGTYLGGNAVAGGKIKEVGLCHWAANNVSATNESGFTALPGGIRNGETGVFNELTTNLQMWTSTEFDSSNAWYRYLSYNHGILGVNYYPKGYGFTVRLIKD